MKSLLLVSLGLFSLSCPYALLAQTPPPAPDPTLVNDVLQGKHIVEQRDDISLLRVYQQGDDTTTGLLQFNTQNSVFSNPSNPLKTEIISGSKAPLNSAAAASGRMFNAVNDDVVTISNQVEPNPFHTFWLLNYNNTLTGHTQNYVLSNSKVTAPGPNASTLSLIKMGNFVSNGVQQAVALYGGTVGGGPNSNWGMTVIGAPDPNQHGNLTVGPEYFNPAGPAGLGGAAPTLSPQSMVVGDFNNDGHDEIAIYMVTNTTSLPIQAYVEYFSVDPETFAIKFLTAASVPTFYPQVPALCAGHFTDPSRLDLVVLGQTGNENRLHFEYVLSTFDSQGNWTPQYQTSSESSVSNAGARALFPHAAAVIPPCAPGDTACPEFGFGPEQLVVASSAYIEGQGFWIGDFTEALQSDNKTFTFQFTQKSFTQLSRGCTVDMKLGNFDNQTSSGGYNSALQVAVVEDTSHDCNHIGGSGAITLKIINLNVPPSDTIGTGFQQNNWLQDSTYTNVTLQNGNDGFPQILQLAVGDLQGRSIRFGSPEVVHITQEIQPQLILGIPPMHVDYATPAAPDKCQAGANTPTPCIYNLTVRPFVHASNVTPFASNFSFSSTSSSNLQNQDTTSWGFAEKVTVGAKVSLTDGIESGSDSLKDSISSFYKSTVAKTYTYTASLSDTLSGNTGFSDLLLYRARGMNVFYYPVLQPGYQPNATDTQYVEFSVPTSSKLSLESATNQEWYQPVQEPGNALSYPSSEALLEASYGQKLTQISDAATCKSTDDTGGGFSASWSNQQGKTVSAGSVSAFSNDLSMSESVGAGISSIFGASVSFGVDLNVSTSLNSLNVETNTLGSSDGVAGTKPHFSNTTNSVYSFGTYLMGQPPKQPSQDSITAPNAGLQTQGPLILAFTTNTSNNGIGDCSQASNGSWWGGTYTAPDIGFNHPARWSWDSNSETVSFNGPGNASSNPILTPFYWMKGFFITSAAAWKTYQQNPQSGPLTSFGPNLTEAQSGDQLALSARVYNFSLVDTPYPATVDFYAQTYCSSSNDDFTQLCGNAVYLGRATTNGIIPGYVSTTNNGTQPNWSLATIEFDTGNYPQLANQHLMFWTVAWMQDASGNLVPEMPAHGLTSVPPGNLAELSNVPVEAYSNNVGAYAVHSPFFIAPLAAPGSSLEMRSGRLSVPEIHAPHKALLASYVPIKARFGAVGDELRNVRIHYYERSPGKEATLIDRQTLHRIKADSSVLHETLYQPQSCGVHTFYTEAFLTPNAAPVVSTPIHVSVEVDPVASVTVMIRSVEGLTVPPPARRELLEPLLRARKAFENGNEEEAIQHLKIFREHARLVGKYVDNRLTDQTNSLLAQATTVMRCERDR